MHKTTPTTPSTPTAPPTPQGRSPGRTLALPLALAAAAATGCVAYEPPQPGRHRAPGEPRAEIQCSYETAAASRFMTMRCLRTEDKEGEGEDGRRAADGFKTQVPVIQ